MVDYCFPRGNRGKLASVICHAVQNVAQDHHATPKTSEQPGLVFGLEDTAQSCQALLSCVFTGSTSD